VYGSVGFGTILILKRTKNSIGIKPSTRDVLLQHSLARELG